MKKFHLVKGDSSDLGFATTCLVGGVITFSEFKDWLYYVIANSDDLPNYIFEIIELEGKFAYTLNARKIVGFDPAWDARGEELLALDGIGYTRFEKFKTDASNREQAINSLSENKHVEALFKEVFPFIKW